MDYAELVGRFSVGSGAEALDDFDLVGIAGLTGPDRDEAVDLFTARLSAFDNDPRVVRALEALNSPTLDEALCATLTQVNDNGVEAARILWKRHQDSTAIPALAAILAQSSNDRTRLVAANVLADITDPAALDVLLDNGQWSAALRTVGLDALESRGRSPISRLSALVGNPLAAVRKPAIAELRMIIVSTRAGESTAYPVPDDGVDSDALKRWRTTFLADPKECKTLDTEAFRQLRGEERLRGLQFLYSMLADHDARAATAIGELNLTETLPALTEAAASGPTYFEKVAQTTISGMTTA